MPFRLIVATALALGLAVPSAALALQMPMSQPGPPVEARPGECYASSGRDIKGVYRWEQVTCESGQYFTRSGDGATYTDACWALVDRRGDRTFEWDRVDCSGRARAQAWRDDGDLLGGPPQRYAPPYRPDEDPYPAAPAYDPTYEPDYDPRYRAQVYGDAGLYADTAPPYDYARVPEPDYQPVYPPDYQPGRPYDDAGVPQRDTYDRDYPPPPPVYRGQVYADADLYGGPPVYDPPPPPPPAYRGDVRSYAEAYPPRYYAPPPPPPLPPPPPFPPPPRPPFYDGQVGVYAYGQYRGPPDCGCAPAYAGGGYETRSYYQSRSSAVQTRYLDWPGKTPR